MTKADDRLLLRSMFGDTGSRRVNCVLIPIIVPKIIVPTGHIKKVQPPVMAAVG